MRLRASRVVASIVAILSVFFPVKLAHAQDVLLACDADIDKFCSQVTPGEGRLIACAYAHEEKLSDACDEAIGEAADQLDWFMAQVREAIETCAPDIEQHCASVAAGGGRVYRCLKENKAELTEDCGAVVDTVTARLTE